VELDIQALLLSVSDLEQSIDFYESVLEATVIARDRQIAVVLMSDKPRRQVLALREAMVRNPVHLGGGSLGMRFLAFETSSLADLDGVERRLIDRGAFVTRRSGEGWEAVVGHDPDRNHIGVSANPMGGPISAKSWAHLDDFLYSVAP
jgi:catechol 2,3-dioxygenase-like lactoylglutathione lyase family enzyme